jgi:hypothetical protein
MNRNVKRFAVGASLVGAYISFIAWLYYPALFTYFAMDDWVVLWHTTKLGPNGFLGYFSPETVWFYRPLQTMQYGLTYRAVGLEPFWYNIQLLAMYICAVGLSWMMVSQIFGKGVATVTALLLSVSAVAPDLILWKANFNTLQFTILTLAGAATFVRYLKTRDRRWFAATVAIQLLNWFTKESNVNYPLIMTGLWLFIMLDQELKTAKKDRLSLKKTFVAGTRELSLFYVLSLVYTALHSAFFVDVEPHYEVQYSFVDAPMALYQLLRGINYSILHPINELVILTQSDLLGRVFQFVTRECLFIPFLLLLLGMRNRSALPAFTLLFASATLVPTFALWNYYETRYYFLPELGGITLIAGLAWPALKGIPREIKEARGGERPPLSWIRVAGYASLVLLVGIYFANLLRFQQYMGYVLDQSSRVQAGAMAIRKTQIPDDSLIIIYNEPPEFLKFGVGATEMVYLLTGRPDIGAVTETILNKPEAREPLAAWPNWLGLNLAEENPRLFRVK